MLRSAFSVAFVLLINSIYNYLQNQKIATAIIKPMPNTVGTNTSTRNTVESSENIKKISGWLHDCPFMNRLLPEHIQCIFGMQYIY